ncbi:YIP1 family protein [Planococcus sp. MERTA32b]|nr:YIP1 family protein [Planococcus sp. MER TA 32b]
MNLSKETPESRLNPFISIWTKPRLTVRQVMEEQNSRLIFLLLVLSGYMSILTGALDTDFSDSFGIWSLVLGGLIFSPLVAAIGNMIGAIITLWIGKIFKGTGTYDELFRALLAGQIPQIWLIPVLLLWIFLWPTSYFTVSVDAYTGSDLVLNSILSFILFVISIWTFVVQSKAVGEAHGLSAWKGAAIILIPLLTIIVLGALFIAAATFAY